VRADIANMRWRGSSCYVRLRPGPSASVRAELWRERVVDGAPVRELVTFVISTPDMAKVRALELYREALEVMHLQAKGEETGQLHFAVTERDGPAGQLEVV